MGLVIGLLVLALTVAACGGGKKDDSPGSNADAREIVIELGAPGNEFSFNPDEVTLTVNEPVRLVARNVGTVPHDLHIPDLNVNIAPVPVGQETVVTFTPTKAGDFRMECHEPGHTAMVGTVTVVQ